MGNNNFKTFTVIRGEHFAVTCTRVAVRMYLDAKGGDMVIVESMKLHDDAVRVTLRDLDADDATAKFDIIDSGCGYVRATKVSA